MNFFFSICRILLPPILCVFCLYFLIDDLFLYPLTFGLIIGFFNWNFHIYKPLIGVLLSVFVSYLTFFVAYFSLALTAKIFDSFGDTGNIIALTISTSIIAPILVFYAYKYVFYISKSKLTLQIILISIVLLILESWFFYDGSLRNDDIMKTIKIINPYSVWQIIMAIALQLLITCQKLNEENQFTGSKSKIL